MSNPYAPPDPTKPRPPRPAGPDRSPRERPPQRPEPPRPAPKLTPEQIRSVTTAVMVFGLLMLLTLLASELEVPWQLLGPVVGVATFVHGVRTIGRVRRLGWRGMLVPLLVGGLLLTALTTVSATVRITLFWDAQVAYQQCRETAVTISAQERCEREYDEATDPRARLGTG